MAELSGLEVFVLAKEIESSLHGTYVKNVYTLGESQVIRLGSPGGEDQWLLVSPRLGVWASKKVSERVQTSPFTTQLRQELVRARFISASQADLDRVFDLTFGEGDHLRHLIVELMPPGNIVVTDSTRKVRMLLNEVRSPSRRLARGGPYSYPPQRRKSPAEVSPSDVSEAARREKTAGGAVGRTFALPGKYVAETLARVGMREEAPSSELLGMEQAVADALRGIVSEAAERPSPCICETPKGDEILVVVPRSSREKSRMRSVSEICDELLLQRAVAESEVALDPAEVRRKELETTIARLRNQEQGLATDATRLRDLALRARGAASVDEAAKMLSAVDVEKWRQFNSQEAAASFLFDRAKESERKAEEARQAADDLSKRKTAGSGTKPRRTKELKKARKEWYEKFRWFFTSAGKLAIGGRDAQSNSILVKRHLEGGDVVYHADLFGSPFFVLKGGAEQAAEEQAEVAQATVAYSSAWKTGLGSADAYWVNSDQISTSAPSGEYLPRGGFLVRGKKNFVPRNLVELAVGIDETGKVIAGPEGAIGKSATAYVVLRPQKEKSSETAKRVAKDLAALAPGVATHGVGLDDVARMLPAGGGKVLRKHVVGEATPEPRNA